MRRVPIALLTALLLSLAAASGAAELKGVRLPDTASVDGHDLVLNGMGLRTKFFIKVYVAGLYLPAKTSDPDHILAADEPRRTVMHFLFGVGKEKICEAWHEGVEANRPAAEAKAVAGQLDTLCGWMEDMEKNDTMVFTYLPDRGTSVEVKGQAKGTLEGKALADALWSTWIGPKPPGQDFKEGLLGQ